MSVFLNFNKIKAILDGCSESDLAKALTRSELLELSEDQSKVRRKPDIPMKTVEEIDECTIYVEQIPINFNHDIIFDIFTRYGQVNYVSLPRYKKSKQIKQFGFVEFDNPETVTTVINAFRKFDAVLQYTSLKPENLLSITTFSKDEPEETVAQTSSDTGKDESDEPRAKRAKLELEDEKPVTEPVESLQEVPQIELKTEVSEMEHGDGKDSSSSSEDELDLADTKDDNIQKLSTDEPKKKKKVRKHKRKSNKKNLFDERVMAMKIMRKKDWKKMRNAYLNSERQKAKEIKKVLRESYNKRNNNKKMTPANMPSPFINFYGSPNDRAESVDVPETSVDNSSGGLVFIPGVIVNIKFREPCLDFKELKKEMKQYPFVQFVEISESGMQSYIRVDAPSSAQELINQYSSCEYETDILKGDAEKEYWRKIFEKRDKKKTDGPKPKSNPSGTRRRRGREKLLEKIVKVGQHIKFEDNDDVGE